VNRSFASLALAGVLLVISSAARADTFMYTISAATVGYDGSGTITANALGDGSYLVTAITGDGTGGLLGAGTFDGNDNLLLPTATTLADSNGFAFTQVAGGDTFNVDVYSNGGNQFAFLQDASGYATTIPVTFLLTSETAVTAEPASLILVMTGAIAAFALSRKKLWA
jgi:hypothetical protein